MTLGIALIAASCSGSGGHKQTKEKLALRSGPIVGLSAGVGRDEFGLPTRPSTVFRPDSPAITVVALVGAVHDSALTFTWYREDAGRDEKLFSQQVAVQSLDRAYSVAKNTSTLASGTYRVEASTNGGSKSVSVKVEPDRSADASGAGAKSGQSPANGGAGTTRSGGRARPRHGTICVGAEDCGSNNADPWGGRMPFVIVTTNYAGDPIELTAGVASRELVGYLYAADGSHATMELLDVCGFDGGSDLPGAKLHVEAQGEEASAEADLTLNPDKEAPGVTVSSTPVPGKVKPGQQISVTITGSEKRHGGSWATGVKRLGLFANGAKVSETPAFGDRPEPCDRKAWKETRSITYTVPPSPPPDIELCGKAVDWAGNVGEQCADFFTAKTWSGQIHLDASISGEPQAADSGTGDGTISLAEQPNGELSGRLLVHRTKGCDRGPGQKSFNVKVRGHITKDKLVIESLPSERVTNAMGEPICGFPDGFFADEGEPGSPVKPFVVPIISPTTADGTGEITDVEEAFAGSPAIHIRTVYRIHLQAH